MNHDSRKSFQTLFVLWLAIIFMYCLIHQKAYDNPMALSRLDVLHALVSEKTFAIDKYHENTADKTISGEHYFSDKAPGTVLLAFPSFFVTSRVLSIFNVPLDSDQGWFVSSWICTAASIGVITATGLICLFLWLQRFMSSRCALLSTLVVAFGSMTFPYSTMLLSHGLVVGLISMALWLLRLGHGGSDGEARRRGWRDVLAGTACGVAIACEYDAALAAGGLLAVVCASSLRRGGGVVLGAVPAVLLIPWNNWVCLGSIFKLPYGHVAVVMQMYKGFYGVHYPDVGNLVHLLFSPERGLFFWTPFLMLVFFGYAGLYGRSRPLFWLCYLVPLMQEVIMSGYWTTTAGNTLGARFLTPLLPLLILPAGIAASRAPWLGVALAVWSIAVTGGATLVNARLPTGCDNPLLQYYAPKFLAGHFTHNVGEVVGLQGWWSMAPILLLVFGGIWYVWRCLGGNEPMDQDSAAPVRNRGLNK